MTNSWKNVKKNAIFLKLFWYKVFVHWKLKLLNFLVDSVLICFLVTGKYVVDEDLDSVLI